jgi:hypothetical protein
VARSGQRTTKISELLTVSYFHVDASSHAAQAEQKWSILDTKARSGKPVQKRKVTSAFDKQELVPMSFWIPSSQYYDEVIFRFAGRSILDLTAVDDGLCMAALRQNIPYTGLAQTAEHARLLTSRIKSKIFATMLDSSSKYFSPELASVEKEPRQVTPPELATPLKKARTVSSLVAASAVKKQRNQSRRIVHVQSSIA